MTIYEQFLNYQVTQLVFEQLFYLLIVIPVCVFVVARAFRELIEFVRNN